LHQVNLAILMLLGWLCWQQIFSTSVKIART